MRHPIPRSRGTGQALVEFSLVLPIFLAILMGAVDLGRVVWASDSLAAAAREAARYGIVHGGSASNPCPVGPPSPDAVIPAPSATCPYPAPSKQSIRDRAIAYAIAGGEQVTVTVCYGAGCTGDADAPNATNARGTPVTVVVSSRVSLTIPALLGIQSFQISGSSTMVVNH